MYVKFLLYVIEYSSTFLDELLVHYLIRQAPILRPPLPVFPLILSWFPILYLNAYRNFKAKDLMRASSWLPGAALHCAAPVPGALTAYWNILVLTVICTFP